MKGIIFAVFMVFVVQVVVGHQQYPENQCPETLGDQPVYLEITDDCDNYIKCDNFGVPQVLPCPAGLVFDTDYNVCVRPEDSTRPDCGGKTPPPEFN